jgi:hypothetical protein
MATKLCVDRMIRPYIQRPGVSRTDRHARIPVYPAVRNGRPVMARLQISDMRACPALLSICVAARLEESDHEPTRKLRTGLGVIATVTETFRVPTFLRSAARYLSRMMLARSVTSAMSGSAFLSQRVTR